MSFDARTPPELVELLRGVGSALKRAMPPGVGFTLFIFEYGKDGFSTYMSTAQRDDMVRELRGFLELVEAEGRAKGGST